MARFKPFFLPPPTLPTRKLDDICDDHVHGACLNENCRKSHEICRLDDGSEIFAAEKLVTSPNTFNRERSGFSRGERPFDDDGPGRHSAYGPRHDNDYEEIRKITILPTTDEILADRKPFMPMAGNMEPKDTRSPSDRSSSNVDRLIEKCFRQLRYDSINGIIAACHRAMQILTTTSAFSMRNYEYVQETPGGVRFSLFRKVKFEELMFHEYRGIIVRASYDCPFSLQGTRMSYAPKVLEKGMLAALIGLDKPSDSLHTTFFEVFQRESTEAMKSKTGNHDRAAVQLSFADPADEDSVRKIAYYHKGLLRGEFALVDFSGVLLAGFAHHLRCLKQLSTYPEIAFRESIAPDDPKAQHVVDPPIYATQSGFEFNLSALSSSGTSGHEDLLKFRPMQNAEACSDDMGILQTLETKTALDQGQARALFEMLSRKLAFTQGPPGTGKSFLGSALAKVILDSQTGQDPKPILVICKTNHALDAFLGDLRHRGINKIVRMGGKGAEDWLKPLRLSEVRSKIELTRSELLPIKTARTRQHVLTREGVGWTDGFSSPTYSWHMFKDHLKIHYRAIFDEFQEIERLNSDLQDLRRVKRYYGFGYEYWVRGGDLSDIESLLDTVNTILGEPQSSSADSFRIKLLAKVKENAVNASTKPNGIWFMDFDERRVLITQWVEELNAWSLCDGLAEVHCRHQIAINDLNRIYQPVDVKCLSSQEIVGATTTGCAQFWEVLRHLKPRVCIIEEAGEVLEPHTLVTLGIPSLEHLLSIGDPLQLRPQLNEKCLSVENDYGKTYRLDESLFERLMFPPHNIARLPISRLGIQRRMHPDIADISRATFYSYLLDHLDTASHPLVTGMAKRIQWFDHRYEEDSPSSQNNGLAGSCNTFEADMTVALIQYLLRSGIYRPGDIAIITPYNRHLALLVSKLRETCKIWLSDQDRETLMDRGAADLSLGPVQNDIELKSMLALSSIDSYQGEEAKVVIFNTVRSNPRASVGFLTNVNRVNVACSRARDGFYVIGNSAVVGQVSIWQKIIKVFQEKDSIGPSFSTSCARHPEQSFEVQKPADFATIGCPFDCHEILECGHACGRSCHLASLHQIMPCQAPCQRTLSCGHQCLSQCGLDCPPECTQEVSEVVLGCGHHCEKMCATAQTTPICKQIIETKQLGCGHHFDVICSEANLPATCQETCFALQSCGHFCERGCKACYVEKCHEICKKQCGIQLECGHRCVSRCSHTGPHSQCLESCLKSCPHGRCHEKCHVQCDPCVKLSRVECDHQGSFETLCCLPFARIPCSATCNKLLACGEHFCQSLCGENCPRCPECENGEARKLAKPQIWLPCQHSFDLDYLDDLFGIASLYLMEDGLPKSSRVTKIPEKEHLRCPKCKEPFSGVRRYLLIEQLPLIQETLERIYAKAGRKLDRFQMEIFKVEQSLRTGFQMFYESLSKGLKNPLDGKEGMRSVWSRTEALIPEQNRITSFLDEVVLPFEISTRKLVDFINNTNILPAQTLPFKLRCDLLYYLCRVIVIEEAVRLIQHFHNVSGSSQQVEIVKIGLKMKAQDQVKGYLKALDANIKQSEDLNLKRLEVEFRLLQITFFLILRKDLDLEVDLDLTFIMERCSNLCGTFPDSAGLFSSILVAQRTRCGSNERSISIDHWNSQAFKAIWRGWGQYGHTGRLEHCRYNHPYPRVSFRDCPECGREVVLRATVPKDKPEGSRANMDDCLQNAEFRKMLGKLRLQRNAGL